jgi:hypothetical protein
MFFVGDEASLNNRRIAALSSDFSLLLFERMITVPAEQERFLIWFKKSVISCLLVMKLRYF